MKYCSDKCRENHSDQHVEDCKKCLLFKQPDGSHLGECPICFLPMPLDEDKSPFYTCCSKTICQGCDYTHHVQNGSESCPFCRELAVDEEEEKKKRKRVMKRVKANDPADCAKLA